MKKIELIAGIESSVLGFGCAPILGSIEPRKAKSAVLNAIDYGINHFDLARSYGYGEAEQFIGKLLKKQRHKLVYASKFGIEANWKAGLLSPAKYFFWYSQKLFRKSKETVKRNGNNNPIANNFIKKVEFSGKKMRESLEKSLDALQTDYLDYFFLHEPLEKLCNLNELLETAEKLKQEGKIRALGLAYTSTQQEIHKSYMSNFDILQFDNSPGREGYADSVVNRGTKSNIIFSPLRGGLKTMTPSEKLIKLSEDFPTSVILCSMFTESHLKENTSLFKY